MTLSKYTKRFQITLNASKEKDKIILDYLNDSYNPNDKIKELLYIAIVSQGEILKDTVSNSEKKLLTISNNTEQRVIETISDSNTKSLTKSNCETKEDTVTEQDKIEKIRQNELDQLKEFM